MVDFALIVFILITIALSVFQILLILGYPLGEYAWGGQSRVLPRKLRIGSVTSIFIYLAIVTILLSKAGKIAVFANNTAAWLIVIYLGLGIFMNGISRSHKERNLMTPVTIVMFLCALIIASA